jgi:replicative superfamily II helicase
LKVFTEENNLVPTSQFPFARYPFEYFNPVQSRVIDFCDSRDNVLVASATASGKTICGELYISNEIRKHKKKVIYLSPLRMLSQEKLEEWTDPSWHFADLKIAICTGDYRLTPARKAEIDAADLVVMTSELLNCRSRNFRSEHSQFLREAGCIVIDECFSEHSVVITDRGEMSIGDIIDNKLDVSVLSLNPETNEAQFKPVVASQKKLLKREWVTLYYDGGHVQVTSNQLLLVNGVHHPACEVQAGDRVEVIDAGATNLASYQGRGADTSRDTARGWESPSFGDAQHVGAIQMQSFSQAGSARTVAVRKIEKAGRHPSCNSTERRLRRFCQAIHDSLISRTQGIVSPYFPKRNKECNAGLARPNYSSNRSGVLAHGRRQFRRQRVYPHGGILESRERTTAEMADGPMGVQDGIAANQNLFSPPVHRRWEGSILGSDQTICYTEHGVQDRQAQSTCPLSLLWKTVLDFEVGKSAFKAWSVLRRKELLSRAEEILGRLQEESICCDLQVADNANFFVRHPDASAAVLAHNCHLLGVTGRGDHLENGIMKFTEINPDARLVLLSATMPNVEEIALWVEKLTGRNCNVINSSYRPCPLNVSFPLYQARANYEDNEEQKINKALSLIREFPDKFLAFVHSKRTGATLLKRLEAQNIPCGFYSADLSLARRKALRQKFLDDPAFRVLVSTSSLAWGVQLPARRVVILGVHRGRSEVDNFDIWQQIGRAGRPKYDPAGDAYVLLPHVGCLEQKQRILAPTPIESKMTGANTLAFHIVSEIHHGGVRTVSDLERWYRRSFAFHQKGLCGLVDCHDALQRLEVAACIRIDGEAVEATSLGMVASMFYYDPFDASALCKNLRRLFHSGKERERLAVAFALASTPRFKQENATAAEKADLEEFFCEPGVAEARRMYGKEVDGMGDVRAAYCYCALMDNAVPYGTSLGTVAGGLKADFERLGEMLSSLDDMVCKWGRPDFFADLKSRVVHGVEAKLAPLVRLAGIGPMKADKLYKGGLRTLKQVADNPAAVAVVLRCKPEVANKICAEAKSAHFLESIA